MKISSLLLVLFLSGCALVQSRPEWPKSPDVAQCPDLTLVPEGTEKLSETLIVISQNYGKYHECKARVEAWSSWYNEQKKIYEESK